MSLILAFHNKDFGVVCTDGRVSMRLPDGSQVACPGEVGRKSAALKPDLILAGSSSWSKELDYYIFGRIREFVQDYPRRLALWLRVGANAI